MKFSGVPGDLHWEYLRAGEYETQWFCNGYRYRVDKDSYNEWRIYYIWYFSSEKPRKWKRLNGMAYRTKKEAQEVARRHNLNPRTRWRYIGRVPEMGPLPQAMGKIFRIHKHYGDLMFVRVTPEGNVTRTDYPEFLPFESVYVEVSELPEDHPARKLEDAQ